MPDDELSPFVKEMTEGIDEWCDKQEAELATEAKAEDEYLEPATFGWTRSGYIARKAWLEFSSHLDSDY